MSRLLFTLQAQAPGSRARAATFQTLHGRVQTPVFMPVGTQATVKSQTVESLKTAGSSVLLANTYHLLLRPGPEVLKKFGGIHCFMNWDQPVLTDSGGFQIFSLPHSRQMTEEGATFMSYVDKKKILLSPEVSIATQRAIGSDIMMVLDQCIPSTSPHEQARAAMELTHRWAKRSLVARADSPQALFGIVQGACFEDLRKQSADTLTHLQVNGQGFDGFAIGGLAVGESKAEREDFAELTASLLPPDLPRYLMGVGTPIDILEAVHRGVDLFDCILPSQLAQRGVAFTSRGKFQLRRGVYKFSEERLDPECTCTTCSQYSRAYLHHLHKTEEPLGWHLIALHNFTFYHRLMREIRASILEERFLDFYTRKRKVLVLTDDEHPSTPLAPPKVTRAQKNLRLGDYEVQVSPKGFASIGHTQSGEVMHSVNPPEVEARTLYIEPSQITARLQTQSSLVIWDVGLGAATNAMCTIQEVARAHESNPELQCNTQIISFDNDLHPLQLALKNQAAFPYLRHAAPHELLKSHIWKNPNQRIEWQLLEGDFEQRLTDAPAPDLIYFDPFSLKTNPALWSAALFARIRKHCGHGSAQLMTYSASTAVRAILLSQGYFVAYGAPTGPKATTTLAFTALPERAQEWKWLGQEWLDRWSRSESKLPEGVTADAILGHPQFRSGFLQS